ncbi:ribosome maturation factor RimM [Pseudothermotoga thermarum]|uniref:Ribosome maturation factor RimM n=1 Tax=Pseudothermotoga thermarum DSM 5069 TaxID=688269 RepID=F7YY58_9THEM|nr:ribosome maturation factor RimM [Pseudothermotoga thermarum]AEH50872.1 16S rRNA processing protein RimM [Pseudothermotoga thermarum DSM 5069]
MKDFVVVGIITKTHGLFGQVKIVPTTNIWGFLLKFKKLKLYDEARDEMYELDVEKITKGRKSLIVKFSGISDSENASKLVGLEIVVNVSELPKLKPNEFYYFEVLGIDVFDEAGNFVGKVEDVFWNGSNEVLVIRKDQEEMLFPMIRDYVIEFERGKRLKIKVPEWI